MITRLSAAKERLGARISRGVQVMFPSDKTKPPTRVLRIMWSSQREDGNVGPCCVASRVVSYENFDHEQFDRGDIFDGVHFPDEGWELHLCPFHAHLFE
jgi:hypothetical protein